MPPTLPLFSDVSGSSFHVQQGRNAQLHLVLLYSKQELFHCPAKNYHVVEERKERKGGFLVLPPHTFLEIEV